MKTPSLRRQLVAWVVGALCVCVLLLATAAYFLTLQEVDELLDDSLRQTALLLADRDLRGTLPVVPRAGPVPLADTESQLVAIGRRPDGTLLFDSQAELALAFRPLEGLSVQQAHGAEWRVFTVVQPDRIVQVAQTVSARREAAAESALQMLLLLSALTFVIGPLLIVALGHGLRPLAAAKLALAQRGARSLQPLDLTGLPAEILPVVQSMNDLMRRLAASFETQRHFVANTAHELRSPVTALQLQVQFLEGTRDSAERDEATRELAAGIARIRRLIEQLLSLSRASGDDDGGPEAALRPVALAEVVRQVVARRAAEAEGRGIDLGANIESEAPVLANAEQLEVLVGNLVENALRYSPAGGVVDVIACWRAGAPTLRVIDDGPGILEAERAKVFDRFYRSAQALSSAEFGSGLGLAIVRSIADRHEAVVSLHDGRGGVGLEVRVVFSVHSASQ